MTGKIQTVLGQIEPGELGITQTHEHLVTDLIDYFEMPEEVSERSWVDAPVAVDSGWLRELGQSGCYMEWDTFGLEDTSIGGGNLDHIRMSSDAQRLETLEYMMAEGFGDQIVIGHDVCIKAQRAKYGGKGFDHIIDSIVPRMRARGFSGADINGILVANPARALAF